MHGHEGWAFGIETAEFTLREHFGVAALDGFGLRDRPAAVGAAGGVLHYLTQHLRRNVAQLTGLTFYETSRLLHLDVASLRNLEVLEPLHRDTPGARSLVGALQRTVTPMGARLLRDWLSQPLAEVGEIQRRQDAVEALLADSGRLESLRVLLREVRDLERTLGRLGAGSGSGRDLVALRLALEQVPRLRELAARPESADTPSPSESAGDDSLLTELGASLTPEPALVELVQRAIVDEPPAGLREGGDSRGVPRRARRTAPGTTGRAGLDRAAPAAGDPSGPALLR